jgi:hypothetical protein
MAERAGLFEDTNDDFDVSAFVPKQPLTSGHPAPDAIRTVAEQANFPSREPIRITKVSQRRRRTGRNVQFNTKITGACRDSFYEISDRNGWVLGETMERAIAALQRELAVENSGVKF